MSTANPSMAQISLPSDQDSSGRTLGSAEIKFLIEAIESGTLTSTKGTFVKQVEGLFADKLGMRQAYACSSGTAALHVAVAAIDPEPGDEIITTSITDMGALCCILYQGAIPVFADVDARTYNVTADTIEQRISDKTKAIMVTHLFGNPCQMDEIMELARERQIPVIEDCAQAFLAKYKGRYVGTMGDIGCFSLQQGKHITTGEGGLVVTNDPDLARRSFLFINKAWGYGDENPDHYFLALNYRMNELTGAVAFAQLQQLDRVVDDRRATAAKLTEMLAGIPGVQTPLVSAADEHSYWKYCLHIDSNVIAGGSDAMGRALKDRGVFSAPRYIQKPAFRCQIFRDQVTFGKSRFPFTLARPEAVNYDADLFPGTFAGLAGVLVLPWNEQYLETHLEHIASAVRQSAEQLRKDS